MFTYSNLVPHKHKVFFAVYFIRQKSTAKKDKHKTNGNKAGKLTSRDTALTRYNVNKNFLLQRKTRIS